MKNKIYIFSFLALSLLFCGTAKADVLFSTSSVSFEINIGGTPCYGGNWGNCVLAPFPTDNFSRNGDTFFLSRVTADWHTVGSNNCNGQGVYTPVFFSGASASTTNILATSSNSVYAGCAPQTGGTVSFNFASGTIISQNFYLGFLNTSFSQQAGAHVYFSNVKIYADTNTFANILSPASGAMIATQDGYLSHFLVDTQVSNQSIGPLIYYSVSVSYQKGDDVSTLGNVWSPVTPDSRSVVDIQAVLPLEYGATYKINASVWQQIRSFATGTDIWNKLYQGENQYFTVASTSTNPFQGNGFQGGASTSLPFSSSTFCGVQQDCADPAVASSTWQDFTCHFGNGVKGLCGFVLTPLNGAWNSIYGFIIKSFPINIFYAINEDIERVKSNITATSTPIIVPIFGHDIEVLSSDVISDSGRGIVDWRDIFTKLIWVFLGGIIIVEAILLVGHFKSQKN